MEAKHTGQHTLEVNESNFDSVVIEGSASCPIVADFWAPWCAPCRALGPILEKLVEEYGGRFKLVKINADDNPGLSSRYGVRGIPAVKAFSQGHIVDEFTGALPEHAVRAFIERIVPSPAEELRDSAARVYAQTRDAAQALELLSRAEQLDPENDEVRIDRAVILIEEERGHEAQEVLQNLAPLTRMSDRVQTLTARLELAQGASSAPAHGALEERIAHDPSDLEARLHLAHRSVAMQDYRAALEQLLEIVRQDRSYGDDAARKAMLKVFAILGDKGELVSEFRKKLASAMN